MSVIKLIKKAPNSYLGLRTGGCAPSFPCSSDLWRRVKCGKECPAEPALGQATLMKEAFIPPVPTSVYKEGRAEMHREVEGENHFNNFFSCLDRQVAIALEVKS